MIQRFKSTLKSRQWQQGTTLRSCSPIANVYAYCNFVPTFEHSSNFNIKEGNKVQQIKKIVNRAA